MEERTRDPLTQRQGAKAGSPRKEVEEQNDTYVGEVRASDDCRL